MDAALATCRFVHYAAALTIWGASTFVWVLAPPTITARLARPTWQLVQATAGIVAASWLVWLMLEAATMGNGWSDSLRAAVIVAVLTDTEFGRVWTIHGVACAGLLAASVSQTRWAAWGLGLLVVASLGWIGHAAMQSGPIGWLHRVNLVLHLLSGGFWLGALIPFSAVMRLVDEPSSRGAAIIALQRFSVADHCAVTLVILTGVINTALILGADVLAVASWYRTLLAAKILVVLAMVGLALINRYRLVPRLRRSASAIHELRRNSIIAIALGGCAIALVSVFGILDPYPQL